MDCLRCGSAMITEVFVDADYDAGPCAFTGWHCIICGAILDALILAHHLDGPKAGRRPAGTNRARAAVESIRVVS